MGVCTPPGGWWSEAAKYPQQANKPTPTVASGGVLQQIDMPKGVGVGGFESACAGLF